MVPQRAALVDAIWGDRAARAALLAAAAPRRSRLFREGIPPSIALLIGVFADLSVQGMLLAAAGGTAIGLLLGIRPRGRLLVTGGAAVLASRVRATGRIEAADEIVAPGSGTPSAAWVVELRQDAAREARITLRVGLTGELVIILDGGARVRLPAGPLYLSGAPPQLGDLEHSLEALLNTLDPARTRHDPWPLFPFNVVGEQTFHVGDRVELFGELAPTFVAGAAIPLYREAPATELVPVGVPVLRLVS